MGCENFASEGHDHQRKQIETSRRLQLSDDFKQQASPMHALSLLHSQSHIENANQFFG